jgi:hypothetical protein
MFAWKITKRTYNDPYGNSLPFARGRVTPYGCDDNRGVAFST